MEFLSMSREEVQLRIGKVDKVTVGAAILQQGDSGPTILLLKRNPTEKYYPDVFELPGGKVDATDRTVHDAIIREVSEETQMAVVEVVSPLSRMTYTTEKLEKTPTGQGTIARRRAVQLSYAVKVEGKEFQVNNEEHSCGIWASCDHLDEIPITSDMKALVLEALELARTHTASNK
ncbi:MutT family protein [Colletotrichum kahawae]|uniref:MutT family protein n=1 Tax=Colletotrichum kahawae TaxID=34407 RepID=A0AAE0D2A6_COLKA|nr:MutT family protein [Colletotrichum kahawae]